MSPSVLFLGKILKEWGIRGQVKVLSYNPSSDLYLDLKKIYVEMPEGLKLMPIESVRRHGIHWVFKFPGYENPESCRELRGLQIGLPREDLPEPAEGEYYLSDLVGIPVIGTRGESIGAIQSWTTVGETEVMVVKRQAGGELMIPFHENFVEVDSLKDGKVTLKEAAEELF